MALHAPQLIVGARMVCFVWPPGDPAAAAALLPDAFCHPGGEGPLGSEHGS